MEMHMENMIPTTEVKPNPLAIKFPNMKSQLETLAFMDGPFEDVPAGKHAFAVMGERGDTKHIWDKRKEVEVEAARVLFKKLTKPVRDGGAGYRAFHVTGKDGEKGDQMDEFDPNAERMIFVPAMAGG
jgi:hypothetical protein